jgi:hypothetical protein
MSSCPAEAGHPVNALCNKIETSDLLDHPLAPVFTQAGRVTAPTNASL